MRKNFILDTSVLLYNPNSLMAFGDNVVIIPIEVIEELDAFKRDLTELGHNARNVATTLDQLRGRGNLGEGVALDNKGLLRVHALSEEDYLSKYGLRLGRKADNRILNLAVYLTESDPERPTIIVTKSTHLRLKADSLGIYAEDYEEPYRTAQQIYAGFRELLLPPEVLAKFQAAGQTELHAEHFHPNEYLLLRSSNGKGESSLSRATGLHHLVAVSTPPEGVLGIRPLNLGQSFAVDALLNDDIRMITLLGKAGTGKTLLAVAAGLYKVLKEDRYSKLLICRPTMPMGRDIGFLPGDIQEKMRPWMQPIYDAVDMIRDVDRRSRQRSLPPDILECEELSIEPLTYIRGRSIPCQFIIIDEAQNLTPLEVKTVITRVGHDTKIVLTGDPEQIDNPYVDACSNGFVYLLNKFRDSHLAAHISLSKGERSELAEEAANLL